MAAPRAPRKTPAPRNAATLFVPVLERTLRSLPTTPADEVTVHLARRYARAIDDAHRSGPDAAATALGSFGPKLLAVLERLGATPSARLRGLGGRQDGGDAPAGGGRAAGRAERPVSWLEEMRQARAASEAAELEADGG